MDFPILYLLTPTILKMAAKLNMGVLEFKLVFYVVYYCSPHRYFLNIILIKACNTLHFTELTVSEVLFKYGFKHPQGFQVYKNRVRDKTSCGLVLNPNIDKIYPIYGFEDKSCVDLVTLHPFWFPEWVFFVFKDCNFGTMQK